MKISGPYHTARPRYAGQYWRVTIFTGTHSTTHGFATEAEAQAFADAQEAEAA